jgi:hypothetical protein
MISLRFLVFLIFSNIVSYVVLVFFFFFFFSNKLILLCMYLFSNKLILLCLCLFSNKLILFSSWVCNGVVGSPAFAAFDKGLLYLH